MVQLLVLIWAAARFDSVAVMLLAVGLLPFQERALRSHSYTLCFSTPHHVLRSSWREPWGYLVVAADRDMTERAVSPTAGYRWGGGSQARG